MWLASRSVRVSWCVVRCRLAVRSGQLVVPRTAARKVQTRFWESKTPGHTFLCPGAVGATPLGALFRPWTPTAPAGVTFRTWINRPPTKPARICGCDSASWAHPRTSVGDVVRRDGPALWARFEELDPPARGDPRTSVGVARRTGPTRAHLRAWFGKLDPHAGTTPAPDRNF